MKHLLPEYWTLPWTFATVPNTGVQLQLVCQTVVSCYCARKLCHCKSLASNFQAQNFPVLTSTRCPI
uniref:Uncharacterized protein n=1 Tax=Caenorhabditis japonica TaxID=281687 RepID=A0A8R1EXR8_CAEJA